VRKSYGLSGRESGQGTLEYILVLIIVVIIILTLLFRFNGAFKKYAAAFFDSYIACLLEVGELPGTGSTCSSEMPSFNQKDGKMLLKDNLPESKGGGNKGGGGSSNSANNNHRGETKNGGGGGNAVGRLRDSGRNRSTEIGKVGDGNESSFGGDDKNGVANTQSAGRVPSGNRPATVKMDVNSDGKVEEKSETNRPKSATTTKKVDESNELRPVKSIENTTRKTASAADDDQKGFSVGALVRLLIIILIIVAMVVFFGGQLIQISKSRDKGGGD
jgi:hypothetical protein